MLWEYPLYGAISFFTAEFSHHNPSKRNFLVVIIAHNFSKDVYVYSHFEDTRPLLELKHTQMSRIFAYVIIKSKKLRAMFV